MQPLAGIHVLLVDDDGDARDIMQTIMGDGFWLLSEARGRRWLDGVATLAVTALDRGPRQMTEAGFDSYLRKPVDPNVLCNSVQALARGRKGRD